MMTDNTSKMVSAPPVSLLPIVDEINVSQRILAALEGRLPKTDKKRVEKQHKKRNGRGLSISLVLSVFVLIVGGYLLNEYRSYDPPVPTEQHALSQVESSIFINAPQADDSVDPDVAIIETVTVEDTEMRNPLALITEQKNPLTVLSGETIKSQRTEVSSSAPANRNARNTSSRRNNRSAVKQNDQAEDTDVTMLTSMLEAIYQIEPERISSGNNAKAQLTECDKLTPPQKRAQCRERVCSNLWGKVSECVPSSVDSGK